MNVLRTASPAEAEDQVRKPYRWVSPFRNLRIKGCSRLPGAYRSVPRLSSPLDAKASIRSPYALDRSQQNPCVGTVCRPAVRSAEQRPHMRFNLSLQTMMSSQVSPPNPGGAGQTLQFTMSSPERVTVPETVVPRSLSLSPLVEPDGIEPTTSCLQSTRSTN